jgi:hypothetical protein
LVETDQGRKDVASQAFTQGLMAALHRLQLHIGRAFARPALVAPIPCLAQFQSGDVDVRVPVFQFQFQAGIDTEGGRRSGCEPLAQPMIGDRSVSSTINDEFNKAEVSPKFSLAPSRHQA